MRRVGVGRDRQDAEAVGWDGGVGGGGGGEAQRAARSGVDGKHEALVLLDLVGQHGREGGGARQAQLPRPRLGGA
eukprot:821954-Pleurochrysis_carterae.AAC.1